MVVCKSSFFRAVSSTPDDDLYASMQIVVPNIQANAELVIARLGTMDSILLPIFVSGDKHVLSDLLGGLPNPIVIMLAGKASLLFLLTPMLLGVSLLLARRWP
ncbi:hypothetical protein [Dyella sp. AtDHG13]|uniref:hypothetical protein n=1 Tax=Dyella sp. AtDHG13 TaxID=1938897 RepID=UPI0009433969|nr:hypothetical protein [Dyella sp. AtDHG13]